MNLFASRSYTVVALKEIKIISTYKLMLCTERFAFIESHQGVVKIPSRFIFEFLPQN